MTLQEVSRKARYDHKDWLWWVDKAGVKHSKCKSIPAVKQCLLDCGTQGEWIFIAANDGIREIGHWRMGIILINQMKRGFF